MLIVGTVAGVVLVVVWVVRRSDGRYRFRPSFEAVCEVTVGGRRLVAYSGHRKVIRLADPTTREDTAVLTDSRTWIRTLCETPASAPATWAWTSPAFSAATAGYAPPVRSGRRRAHR
ncbi:hypothetical protein [Streptomyces sp. NPDC003015]